MIKFINLR